ncbi:hypothetical protein ACRAWD_24825 [Caulobacter segnis]
MARLLALLAFVATLGGVALPGHPDLSLSSAATFDAGKVVFFRSMPLTKGRFWPLLGAYFLAVVMCLIVFLLLFTIISAVATVISGDISAAGKLMQADSSSAEGVLHADGHRPGDVLGPDVGADDADHLRAGPDHLQGAARGRGRR